MGCLEENTVLAFAEARLSPEALGRVESHVRECASCRELLAAALNLSGLAHTAATQALGPTPGVRPISRDPLGPGTSIGRFTVLRLVGRGGMGEVYAAYDSGLDRRVALKVMHAEGAAQDGNAQERLLREAQSIAKLSHPNVVVVYEVGAFGGQIFIAMEFVEGTTLAAWLTERPRSWKEILGVFLQAARGLSAAHRVGLVHRDFKPQNVMVARDGTVRVMDFGLARSVSEAPVASGVRHDDAGRAFELRGTPTDHGLTRTGEQLGTPLYMAPEQFTGGRIDARTDQFSLCVALYWALFGVHPFGGRSLSELMRAPQRGNVTAPAMSTGVPAWLQRVVVRGLSVAPGTRWPSMDDLVTALGRDPASRRRRWSYAAVGLIACGVIGLLGVREVRRDRAICMGGPARLEGVWELAGSVAKAGSRREAVHAAIVKSGVSEAQKTWERVSDLLDRHATKWLGMYRDACEATHVRGEQSEDVLDLRTACLGDNLDSTRALTQLLSAGDPRVVEHAVEAASSLEDFERCADVQQLRAGVQPPKDPMIRKEVRDLRERLKAANALIDSGQRMKAAQLADRVLERAEVLGYCPLRAEVLIVKGDSMVLSEPAIASAVFERAIFSGEACGQDRVVARAAAQLVYFNRLKDWEAAERWAALGRSALERMGGDRRVESWLANNLAIVRWHQGRWQDALREFQQAVAIKEHLLGPDHFDVAVSLDNLARTLSRLGRFEEALIACDRAQAIWARWDNPDKFIYRDTLSNRGEILLGLGRLTDAEDAFRASLRIFETSRVQSDAIEQADPLMGLGRIDLAHRRVAEAVSKFERVLQLREIGKDPPLEMAETEFQLAVALDRNHQDGTRALKLARQALATYAAQPVFDRQREEVQAWLQARRAKISTRVPM